MLPSLAWSAAVALLFIGSLAAQDPPAAGSRVAQDFERAADRVVEAFREGGAARLGECVEALGLDRFVIADSLHRRATRAADPAEAGRLAATLDTLVQGAAQERRYEALPRLVAAWRSRDEAARAREDRLHGAVLAAFELHEREDFAGELAVCDRVAPEIAAAAHSVSAVTLANVRASALMGLSRLEEAVTATEELRVAAASIGWVSLEIFANTWIGEKELQRHEPARAMAAFERAIELARRAEAPVRLAEALAHRALAASEAGRIADALRDASAAWSILKQVDTDSEEILDRLANILLDAGAFGLARAVATKSAEIGRREDRPARESRALVAIGIATLADGLLDDALRALERAERLQARPDSGLLGSLGVACTRLGLHERALDAYRRSIAAVQGHDPNGHAAKAHANIGEELFALGRIDEGLKHVLRAHALHVAAGREVDAAVTLARSARFHSARGDREAAEDALEGALETIDRGGLARQRAWVRMGLSAVRADAGDVGAAAQRLEEAVRICEAEGDRGGLADALGCRARLALRAGGSASAAAAASDARRALELRLGIDANLDAGEAVEIREQHRDLADLGLQAVLARFRAAEPEERTPLGAEAAWFAEAGRAVALAGSIANRETWFRAGMPAELLAEYEARAQAFTVARHALAAAGADCEEAAQARDALLAAQAELAACRAKAARAAPRAAMLVAPAPLEAREAAARLADGEALVLYHATGAGELCAIVVDRDGAALVPLGAAAPVLAAIDDWRGLVAARSPAEPRLAVRLGEALLRPLVPLVAARRRLLISPDAGLSGLPFEALVAGGEGGSAARAIERWEFAYLPSGTVLAALCGMPPRAGERFVGVAGGGDGGAPRLREAGAEIAAIAALYPEAGRVLLTGAGATPAAVLEAARAPASASLHVACHAVFDRESSAASGLVLAGGGILGLDDLYRADVPAELAVLSACDTARGPATRGEGVLGLVRGFFHAGCPRVVVASWRLDDASARHVSVAFHEAMRRRGLGPAAALAEVKRAAIRAGAPPADWAALVLWGLPDAGRR